MRDGLLLVHHRPALLAGVPLHPYPYQRAGAVIRGAWHWPDGTVASPLIALPCVWPARELDYHHVASLGCWCRPRIEAGTLGG